MLPMLEVAVDGEVGEADGAANIVLPALQVAIAADLSVEAAVNTVLPMLEVAVDGEVGESSGAANIVLPALQVAIAADLSVEAAVNTVLPMLVVALAGTSEGTPTVTRGSMTAIARPAVQASGRPRTGTTMGGS